MIDVSTYNIKKVDKIFYLMKDFEDTVNSILYSSENESRIKLLYFDIITGRINDEYELRNIILLKSKEDFNEYMEKIKNLRQKFLEGDEITNEIL